jgi:hypothetical protein
MPNLGLGVGTIGVGVMLSMYRQRLLQEALEQAAPRKLSGNSVAIACSSCCAVTKLSWRERLQSSSSHASHEETLTVSSPALVACFSVVVLELETTSKGERTLEMFSRRFTSSMPVFKDSESRYLRRQCSLSEHPTTLSLKAFAGVGSASTEGK